MTSLVFVGLLLLDFARGVADVRRVVLQRGEAGAGAAAVGVDEDVRLHLAVSLRPRGRELDHRVGTLHADFDDFLLRRIAAGVAGFLVAAGEEERAGEECGGGEVEQWFHVDGLVWVWGRSQSMSSQSTASHSSAMCMWRKRYAFS